MLQKVAIYMITLVDNASYDIYVKCWDPEGKVRWPLTSPAHLETSSNTSLGYRYGDTCAFKLPAGTGGNVSFDVTWTDGYHTESGTLTVYATGDGSTGDLSDIEVAESEGLLPGFTAAMGVLAMLGAAMIAGRRNRSLIHNRLTCGAPHELTLKGHRKCHGLKREVIDRRREVFTGAWQNQNETNRKSTFETALSMRTIINEARAQRAHGRSGFSAGHGSIPKASASRTSAASSCSSSSTDCAAMPHGNIGSYMTFTPYQRLRNKALKPMANSELYE